MLKQSLRQAMDCAQVIAQVPLDRKGFGTKMAVEFPIVPIDHMNLFEMHFGLVRVAE